MTRLLSSGRIRLVAVAFLGVVFAALAFRAHWFQSVDLMIYDLGLSVRPPLESTSKVVLVAVDKQSRHSAFPPPEFPISAHAGEHARLLDRLTEAGARAVAFDVLFDQLDPGLDVAPLAASMKKAGRVCLAGAIESSTVALRTDGSAITEERLVLPSESLADSTFCIGLVNMPLDGDGIARRASYGRSFQGRALPSMPSVLAAAAEGRIPDPAHCIPRLTGPDGATFYIDYRRIKSGIAVIPYAEVLLSDGWQDEVRGRIVLVGVTENSLSDVYEAPLTGLRGAGRDNRLPGALVLAHATETLIGESFVWPLPRTQGLALCVTLAVAASAIALRRRLVLTVAFLLVLVLCVAAAGILMTAYRVTILPSGAALGVLLFTGISGVFAGYIQTRVLAQLQQRELDEISTDLRKAAEIQQGLQPKSLPLMEGFALAGFQIPCKEIGGDYYDVIDLGDGRVGLLIADVCGKGVAAALLMSNLQSNVRQLAPMAASTRQLVTDLNRAALRVFSDGRFVTLLYGVLDRGTREFSYCSAGHMPPMLCHAGGRIADLPEGGIPIGLLPSFEWQEHRTQLEEGDTLFLYTDGLSEARKAKTGEFYGEERITAYLKAHCGSAPDDLNRGIVRDAQSFSESEHLDDDITLLVLRVGA